MPSDASDDRGTRPTAPRPGPPPAPDLTSPPPAPDTRAGRGDPQGPPPTNSDHAPGHPAAPGDAEPDRAPVPPPPPGGTTIAGFPVDPPDTTPHRLPLRSLIGGVNPRALWGALPALFVLRDTGIGLIAIILGILVVGQLVRLVSWSRFFWGFDGEVVRISSGVLWRQVRAVDVARVQQVQVQRPLLHQVMGTAVMTVETASEGGDSEVKLDGLDNETAAALQEAILTARRRERTATGAGARGRNGATGVAAETGASSGNGATGRLDGPAAPGAMGGRNVMGDFDASSDEPSTSILKPSVGDLVRSALTGSSLLIVPLSIVALGEFAFDIFGQDIDEVATEAARAGARIGYVVIALLVLVIGAVGAVATVLLRDWDIELVRQGDDLRLTRGLLTRHATTIPLHRLQVVQYRQNWLRRALGAGTLVLRSAGGAGPTEPGSNDTNRTMSIPWVTTSDLSDVLEAALDRALRTPDDMPGEPESHPPAARRRLRWRWARGLFLLVPMAIGAGFGLGVDTFPTWFMVLAGAVVVAGGATFVFADSQYRRLGHASTSRVAHVTGGVLGATSDWMPLQRLQGVQGDASLFQRRLDLASVRLSPAGSGNSPVVIHDVATDTASDLGRRFTLLAAGREPGDGPPTGPRSSVPPTSPPTSVPPTSPPTSVPPTSPPSAEHPDAT